jgi:hypothetical protein
MSFLNAALLGGVAAVLAPLIIHLLNRSTYKIVDWGAMHLLEAALQVNSRRLQWESILLLVIRCAIPLLLALCLARPVLTSARVAGVQGDKSLVLVLDDSLSMAESASNSDESLADAAKRELARLSNQSGSAEQSLWVAGGKPVCLTNGSTYDTQQVVTAIHNARPLAGKLHALSALRAATIQAGQMANPNRHVVIASDFRVSDWTDLTDDEALVLKKQLESFTPPVQLSLLNVGQALANNRQRLNNLAVQPSNSLPSTLWISESAAFTFTVRNYGPEPVEAATVVFSSGETDIAKRTVSLAAESSVQTTFTCKFRQLGWHRIAAHVEDPAGPEFDDRLSRVVHVIQPIQVLLLASSSEEGFRPDTDYLRLALAPFSDPESGTNRFRVQVAAVNKTGPSDWEIAQVVVLCGIDRLDETVASRLVEFVRSGGGLIVFPDNSLDSDWFNRRLFEQDELLPMRYGQRTNTESPVGLLRGNRAVRQMQLLQDGPVLKEPPAWEFTEWQHMEQPRESATIAVQLSNRDALLATQLFGQGRVYQFAVSSDDKWSNLPLKSVFVPFIQHVAMSAAMGSRSANFRCGESASVSVQLSATVDQRAGSFRNAQQVSSYQENLDEVQVIATQIETARGQSGLLELPLQVDDKYKSVWRMDTRYPGLFSVTVTDPGLAEVPALPTRFTAEPPVVSVELAAEESRLQSISHAQLLELGGRLGAEVIESAEEFAQIDRRRQVGREIWNWLWAGLFFFVICRGVYRALVNAR